MATTTEEIHDKTHTAPVEIMRYFDIQKDAKFSLRTLLLLSVFSIAVFMFGLKPEIAGLSIPKEDYFAFSIVMLLVIVGQYIIARYAYKLYEPYIDNFTIHLKNDIKRINTVLDGIPSRKDLISEAIKNSHKDYLEEKLSKHEDVLEYSGIFYKKINGKYLFWVAGIAIISIVCSLLRPQGISSLDYLHKNNDPILLSIQLPEPLKLELNQNK